MNDRVIAIAKDFSRYPGGRWRKDGPFSGEQFRDELLLPALKDAERGSVERVVVDLDGAAGYGSSFLEEAFGGAVRSKKIAPATIRSKLKIMTTDPIFSTFRTDAERYVRDALENSA